MNLQHYKIVQDLESIRIGKPIRGEPLYLENVYYIAAHTVPDTQIFTIVYTLDSDIRYTFYFSYDAIAYAHPFYEADIWTSFMKAPYFCTDPNGVKNADELLYTKTNHS